MRHPERAKADQSRILVVEDDPVVRFSVVTLLHEWSCESLAAASGEEALDLAVQEGLRFDAIIADHRLGGGLAGVATAKETERRAGRALPAIVLTGDTGGERILEIESSGFAILHKPVDPDGLQREIGRALSAGAAS